MSTKQGTVEYIEDQLAEVPGIRSRKMFGDYALYCNDKVVALVCDGKLFVKITEPGRAYLGEQYEEGLPYQGAKPWMHIDEDLIEDRAWLAELIRITEAILPLPKPKKKKSKAE